LKKLKVLNSNLKSHIALFIATLLFAINYWISKDLVGSLNVIQLVSFRTIGAAIIFSIIFLIRPKQKVLLKDKLHLAIAGFFGIALNQILFFGGLQYTSAVDTATIHVSNPVIVLGLSIIFLKSRFTRTRLIGIVLGAIGALVLILYQKGFQIDTQSIKGNLMILGNTTAYAIFLVMLKSLLKKYDTFTVMFWVYLFASLIIMPFGVVESINSNIISVIQNHAFSLFYIVVMITFLAYFLSTYSLRKLSPTVVSFYIYLQPVLAMIIAIILGEELPDIVKIVASLVIFTGVYMVSKERELEK